MNVKEYLMTLFEYEKQIIIHLQRLNLRRSYVPRMFEYIVSDLGDPKVLSFYRQIRCKSSSYQVQDSWWLRLRNDQTIDELFCQ